MTPTETRNRTWSEIIVFVVVAIVMLRLGQSDSPRIRVVGAGTSFAPTSHMVSAADVRVEAAWRRHEAPAATLARARQAIRESPRVLVVGFDDEALVRSDVAWGRFMELATEAENANLITALIVPPLGTERDVNSSAERRRTLCSGRGFRFCVESLPADASASARQRLLEEIIRDGLSRDRAYRASTQGAR